MRSFERDNYPNIGDLTQPQGFHMTFYFLTTRRPYGYLGGFVAYLCGEAGLVTGFASFFDLFKAHVSIFT